MPVSEVYNSFLVWIEANLFDAGSSHRLPVLDYNCGRGLGIPVGNRAFSTNSRCSFLFLSCAECRRHLCGQCLEIQWFARRSADTLEHHLHRNAKELLSGLLQQQPVHFYSWFHDRDGFFLRGRTWSTLYTSNG